MCCGVLVLVCLCAGVGDAGCLVLVAGCWGLSAGCWVLGVGCWVPGAGWWVVGAGWWLVVVAVDYGGLCLWYWESHGVTATIPATMQTINKKYTNTK